MVRGASAMHERDGSEPNGKENNENPPADAHVDATPTSGDADGDEAVDAQAAAPESTEADELRARLREMEARLRTVSKAYTDLEQEMDAFRKRMTVQADQRAERKAGEAAEAFFEPVQNLKR